MNSLTLIGKLRKTILSKSTRLKTLMFGM